MANTAVDPVAPLAFYAVFSHRRNSHDRKQIRGETNTEGLKVCGRRTVQKLGSSEAEKAV